MRVGATTQIVAPVASVWEIAADPTQALGFMSGVTRWEPVGDAHTGLGARYRVLFRLGQAEIGGLIEMVEWDDHREFAWTSLTGIDQRGRVRLQARDNGRTEVEFRLSYSIAGAGISGWITERFAAAAISAHLRRTLTQLGRQVENEQIRQRAERQRVRRAAAQ